MPIKKILPAEKLIWNLSSLVDLQEQKKLIINSEYQRSEVWKLPKKQLLIDSLLNDYDIGNIILRAKEDKWEIIDGQQRLKAVFDFVDNKFPLSPETAKITEGKTLYKELSERIKWSQLLNRQVYTTKIYSIDDETTSTIFLRVQEGMPLNAAEKLNAKRGALRNKIVEVTSNQFLNGDGKAIFGVAEFRFAYRYLLAQMVLQEIDAGVSNHIFKDSKFLNLEILYNNWNEKLPPKVFDRIYVAINFLKHSMAGSSRVINKKSDLLSVYLLSSYLAQKYSIRGKEAAYKSFLVDFFAKIEHTVPTDTAGYYQYWVARSSSPDSKKQIAKRFEIILKKFLEYMPDMELKAKQRDFDFGQKLAIYDKALKKARIDGKKEAECVIGKHPTPYNRGEPDHIKAYVKGGLTTVENGQWTCREHNRSKGGK